jgi:sarcosine oxidase
MIDVIVVGLGAMGSSAAYHLAKRGKRVLGLEQFTPIHDRGSSHGHSRIIRQAYYENPAYVPLLLRAYELWEQLEQITSTQLLTVTGGLMIGSPASEVFAGSLRSAREHSLKHEVLDSTAIQRRFPAFTPTPDVMALYEFKAGYLRPEECIRQHLNQAARHGADFHFEEPIESWTVLGANRTVRVKTTRNRYEAERLVMCSGAWSPQLLADLNLPLIVTRQIMFWFDPQGDIDPFLPERFPIYIWQPDGLRSFYGFPATDGRAGGVKVAIHGSDNVCEPDTIDREISESDMERMRRFLAPRIPSLNGIVVNSKTCMYTTTPDENFVVAAHPEHPMVTIAAGFSGHGFKFSSVVGEILADLVTIDSIRHDIRFLSPKRFKAKKHSTL